MFVGAINATVRKFLANTAQVFDGQVVVVGCSGNFTSETVLSHYARPAAIHANDVSFYSCMAGRWLTGQPLDFAVVDPEYEWLAAYLDSAGDTHKLAAIMTLLDMLEYEKRNNPHRVRMWSLYYQAFDDLVEKTAVRLSQVEVRLASFYEGDVLDHFERFGDEDKAIFCCYAPTYAGGYERLYKRLDRIVTWDEPEYELLDEARRDRLLAWMSARRFLWYDDRIIEGMQPVMEQRAGRRKTVYLYSNVIQRPAFFMDSVGTGLPGLPLASASLEIKPDSKVQVIRIKTSDLLRYKDAFLSKKIDFGAVGGYWAYAILIDGLAIGFMEFKVSSSDGPEWLYLMSDFCVPGTRYKRLSKLVLMVVKSGETCRMMQKIKQLRLRHVGTTAFTDKPVSMKYRGVFNLAKRGETPEGQKYINYEAEFDDLSWQEVLREWWTRHGSIT